MPGYDPTLSTRFLDESRKLAVVGLSQSPFRDSHTVSQYMISRGYEIVGVHPDHDVVLDSPCYPSLSEIPEDIRTEIDLVVVFRRPDAVPDLLRECAALGLQRVWLQLGVSSPAAVELADEIGLEMVTNECLRVVHSVHSRS